MKTLITVCVCLLSLAVSAQTVTVTFPGAAKNAKTYQVVIDGVNYYSVNSVSTKGRQITTIENLSDGAHTLEVFTSTNRNTGYSDGTTTRPSTRPVYKKTFQLRDGYDMNIAVRGNGQVSFTEKRNTRRLDASVQTPMSSTAFNTLYQTISAKRYQSDRLTQVRNALNKSGNYFTTIQVRQLVSLITSESRRLELAKLSYAKVTDPSNFSDLYDVLNSQASRDALDDYVVDQGGTITSSESTSGYSSPMTNAAFSTLLNRVKSYSYQSGRVSEITSALESGDFFTVPQIRELLTLVTSESEKLALAKMSYNRVVDRTSFNQLVDLFYQQATRTDFNYFITSNGGVAINTNTTYSQAMSDASFQTIYSKARNHFFQKNTVADIKTAFSATSNYFSVEQINYLLQLVTSEVSRLELAKLGYARAVDPMNYYSLLDLFTVQSYKTDLENYIRSKQQ